MICSISIYLISFSFYNKSSQTCCLWEDSFYYIIILLQTNIRGKKVISKIWFRVEMIHIYVFWRSKILLKKKNWPTMNSVSDNNFGMNSQTFLQMHRTLMAIKKTTKKTWIWKNKACCLAPIRPSRLVGSGVWKIYVIAWFKLQRQPALRRIRTKTQSPNEDINLWGVRMEHCVWIEGRRGICSTKCTTETTTHFEVGTTVHRDCCKLDL